MKNVLGILNALIILSILEFSYSFFKQKKKYWYSIPVVIMGSL